MKNIVISTGAGISAESGIHTYRDKDGLWSKFNPMEVSHRKGWLENPQKLLDFKNDMRRQFVAANYLPNAAHFALTRLQKEWPHGEVTIITQNIDGLHSDAGSNVIEIHGTNRLKFCESCNRRSPYDADIMHTDSCLYCGAIGQIRPSVCMFGEMPYGLDVVENKLDDCHIFAVIGSSLEVMPGNLFVSVANEVGAETYYLNMIEPEYSDLSGYRHKIYGPATVTVPQWVDGLLS